MYQSHPITFSEDLEGKKKVCVGEVFMLWCFIPYQHLPLHLRKEHQPSSLSGPHCSKIPSKRQMTGSQTFLKPVTANTCKPTVRAGNLLEVCAGWEHQAALPHQQMQRAAISYASVALHSPWAPPGQHAAGTPFWGDKRWASCCCTAFCIQVITLESGKAICSLPSKLALLGFPNITVKLPCLSFQSLVLYW